MPDDAGQLWETDDVAAIYRHQLSSSVEFDLAGLGHGTAGKTDASALSKEARIRSFGDLLTHPSPPIDLLRQAKRFAKIHRSRADSHLPAEVAAVLYFAILSAALVRLNERITTLDDDAFRSGLEWCNSQAWVEEPVRALLAQALDKIAR